MSAIKARKPTGLVPWPLILLEGGEKSGKSWAAAEFSCSERVGQTYWLDLGEGAADEYGAIPGSRYLVLEHDGTWAQIVQQVEAVRDEAQRVNDAGQPPVVLVVDSMTAEWEMLKDWATNRARSSRRGREALAKDPNADVVVSMNLWNDANARHRRLMTLLLRFPGPVLVTARGGEVAKVGKDGKPVEGQRDYRVEGHKNLAFDATAWVRMSRTDPPVIIGARSVHAGVRPGLDTPKPLEDFSVEWLVFDALRCDPRRAKPREVIELNASDDATRIRDLVVETTDPIRLRELWQEAGTVGVLGAETTDGGDEPTTVAQLIKDRVQNLKDRKPRTTTDESDSVDEPPPSGDPDRDSRMRHLFALLKERGLSDKAVRLRFATRMLRHDDLTTFTGLTDDEIAVLIDALKWMNHETAAEWIAGRSVGSEPGADS